MFLEGEKYLRINRDTVNDLNVFPVPDGDTGTNMCLTLANAAAKVRRGGASRSFSELATAIAETTLLDARGNSGVILSQVYRGLASSLDGKADVGAGELAEALRSGSEAAYDVVSNPKEGTMLTVLREAADTACEIAKGAEDVQVVLQAYLKQAEESLRETPEKLDVLREAGVVDAGGLGVVCIFRGMERALQGEVLEEEEDLYSEIEEFVETPKLDPGHEVEFGYCTEFFVNGEALSAKSVEASLLEHGDSVLVVGGEGGRVLKVHLHTNEPEDVLDLCRGLGEVSKIKVDDIRAQQEELARKTADQAPRELAVVAVASGEGLAEAFGSLGADEVVDGGQTNNPPVEALLEAVERTGARKVIVLPNNKNVVLAARQLEGLAKREVRVVPTRSVPEGLAAMMAYDRGTEADRNVEKMDRAASETVDGHVTWATRDATVSGLTVKEGDLLAFQGEELVAATGSLVQAAAELVEALLTAAGGEAELVTVFHGEGVDAEEAEAIATRIQDDHDEVEVEVYRGGQPVHHLLVSVE